MDRSDTLQQLNDLENQIQDIDRKIRFLQEKKLLLHDQVTELRNLSYRISNKIKPLEGRAITKQNVNFNKAWIAIQHAILDAGRDGARFSDLEKFVCRELPGLNPSTLRSYVHRLKKMEKIKKLPTSRWAFYANNETK